MHEYEQSTRCDTNLVVVVPLFLTYHQQSLGDNTYLNNFHLFIYGKYLATAVVYDTRRYNTAPLLLSCCKKDGSHRGGDTVWLTSQVVLSPSPSMLAPCWGLSSSPAEGSTRPTHASNPGHISPTKRNPAASQRVRQGSEGKVRVLPAIFLGGCGCGGGASDRSMFEKMAEPGERVPVVAVRCCPDVPERGGPARGLVCEITQGPIEEANLMNRTSGFSHTRVGNPTTSDAVVEEIAVQSRMVQCAIRGAGAAVRDVSEPLQWCRIAIPILRGMPCCRVLKQIAARIVPTGKIRKSQKKLNELLFNFSKKWHLKIIFRYSLTLV